MTAPTLAGRDPLEVEPGQWVRLAAVDAVEIIDALEFFCDWFDRDRSRLDASLFRYTGGGYDLAEFRGDLRRLAERLGRAPFIEGPR